VVIKFKLTTLRVHYGYLWKCINN